MDVECAIASQTADCTQTVAGAEANEPGTTSAIVSDISEILNVVTITAGLDLLSGASSATATATGSSSTPGKTTEATTGASVTGTAATNTASNTASGTATSSAAATGAARQLGQNGMTAGLVGLLGVALVL